MMCELHTKFRSRNLKGKQTTWMKGTSEWIFEEKLIL